MTRNSKIIKYGIVCLCFVEMATAFFAIRHPSTHLLSFKVNETDTIYPFFIEFNSTRFSCFVDKDLSIVVPFEQCSIDKFNKHFIKTTDKNNPLWPILKFVSPKKVFDSHYNVEIINSFGSTIQDIHNCDTPPITFKNRILIKKGGKYGLFDCEGKAIINPVYDELSFKSYEPLARIKENGKWGAIDMDGNIVIRPEYDTIDRFQNNYARVKKDGKWGLIDKKGDISIDLVYDTIGLFGLFQNRYARIEKDGKWGFIDTSLFVIDPIFHQVDDFNHGFCKVKKDENSGWNIIDCKGKYLTDEEYDGISLYPYGASIKKDGLYGFVFYDTSTTINPQYSSSFNFSSNDIALVSVKDGKNDTQYSFINKNGDRITNLWFEKAHNYSYGLAAVQTNKLWGFIDERGECVIQPQYSDAHDFYKGFAIVKDNICGNYGVINKTGNYVIPNEYNEISNRVISPGVYFVKKDGKYGVVDTTNKIRIPFVSGKSNDIQFNMNSYSKVKLSQSGWVYFNRQGKQVPKNVSYDELGYFNKGYASVKKDGLWGIIDTTGREIVRPKYELIDGFINRLASVKKDGLWGVIDDEGKEIIKPKFTDRIYIDIEGQAYTKIGNIDFLIDTTGNVKIKNAN